MCLHAGATTTKFLESLPFSPKAIEVVSPGMNTTIQARPPGPFRTCKASDMICHRIYIVSLFSMQDIGETHPGKKRASGVMTASREESLLGCNATALSAGNTAGGLHDLVPPCRTTPGGPSSGMWACPPPAPWMLWLSGWQMPWWAMRSPLQAWRSPSQVQHLPDTISPVPMAHADVECCLGSVTSST